MKTIGYLDRVERSTIHGFCKQNELPMFRQKRVARMVEALSELKSVANIDIYLIDGNKSRKLTTHRM